MVSRLSRKINNQTETHFKVINSKPEEENKKYERCHTEENFHRFISSPTKKVSRDRRGSHKVENFSGLNESKISISVTDSKISQLKMMKRMATMDLKLLMEKKISEKKSYASNSTKTLQTIVSPFRLEDQPEKFVFTDVDEEKQKVNKL
jgi:hypothetical protein